MKSIFTWTVATCLFGFSILTNNVGFIYFAIAACLPFVKFRFDPYVLLSFLVLFSCHLLATFGITLKNELEFILFISLWIITPAVLKSMKNSSPTVLAAMPLLIVGSVSLSGILYFTSKESYTNWFGFTGLFNSSMSLGWYSAVSVLIILIAVARRGISNLQLYALLFLSLTALIASETRMNVVAVMVSIIWYRKIRIKLTTVVSLSLFIIIVFQYGDSLIDKFLLLDLQENSRTELAMLAVESFTEKPILGFGYGNRIDSVDAEYMEYGSLLFGVLCSFGIIGGILFLSAIYVISKQEHTREQKTFLLFVAMTSLTESYLMGVGNSQLIVSLIIYFYYDGILAKHS